MKINKEFAPTTIVLETQDDLYMFKNILEAAYRKRSEGYLFRTPMDADKVVQTIRYLQEKLQ